MTKDKGFGVLHPSVLTRAAQAADRRGKQPLTPEDLVFLAPDRTATVAVQADRVWNRTGVVLEHGYRYNIRYAAGEWRDKECPACGPGGQSDDKDVRKWMRKTKRVVEAAWMELIGHVAHPRPWPTRELPAYDFFKYLLLKDPEELLQSLARLGSHLGSRGDVVVDIESPSGMLYAFANDAWLQYPNNSGAIVLDVTCLGPIPAGAMSVPRFVVASNGRVSEVCDE